MTSGILLIDKPKGWTSFDVVNKVRHLCTQAGFNVSGKKRFPVGHTGTLDPLATGLLVLLIGTYTKKAPLLAKLDKMYEVELQLGQTSTTGDAEGEKVAVSDVRPSLEQVQAALETFVGGSMQVPPAFSAVKVNGIRAYNLARAGKPPELQARAVRIDYIHLVAYEYPYIRFITHVSSGTYIRSLVEDVGHSLMTGAYMTALQRTTVGPYELTQAADMVHLTAESLRAALIQ